MKLLITGGAGFIGSHFVRRMVNNGHDVINVDSLTYAGDLANVRDVEDAPNYEFICADIANETAMASLFETGFDAVVNFAAHTHVDRSIVSADEFVNTNINGTYTLLKCALRSGGCRFVQISTDEVYGSLGLSGCFNEESTLRPSSPYSASKAAADMLVLAYHITYGLDACITRCSNNYGPNQNREKFIPCMIDCALRGRTLPVYGNGLNVREWLYVKDHCAAVAYVLENGIAGQIYNIGGGEERANIDVAKLILCELGRPETDIEFVNDRPGHDFRYALDASKLTALGWHASMPFEEGLRATVQWYTAAE
jgi:dTDP-glucose 4,6-dehydratase